MNERHQTPKVSLARVAFKRACSRGLVARANWSAVAKNSVRSRSFTASPASIKSTSVRLALVRPA